MPPISQRISANPVDWTFFKTLDGVEKIPEPIISPITMHIAENQPILSSLSISSSEMISESFLTLSKEDALIFLWNQILIKVQQIFTRPLKFSLLRQDKTGIQAPF